MRDRENKICVGRKITLFVYNGETTEDDDFTKKIGNLWNLSVLSVLQVNIMPTEFPKADNISILSTELPNKSKYIQLFEARSPKNQRVYLVVTSK